MERLNVCLTQSQKPKKSLVQVPRITPGQPAK